MTFQIISDSSCDLSKEYVQTQNVTIVPFYVSFDGTTYLKEGIEVNHDEFYKKMIEENAFPKSSLPSIQDYYDTFEPFAKEGKPVICICITSKFSGSSQSANNAKDMILENYPDAVITVVDSTLNTVEQGLMVKEVVRMRNNNVPYEQALEYIEKMKPTGRIIFTTQDMAYLKHGGRIGKLLKFASGTLGIKPLIVMKEGEIFPAGITRSRKKSKLKLYDIAKDHFASIKEDVSNYSICVGTGIDYDEAVEFRDGLMEALGVKEEIPIEIIGVTVGTHTGPHPLGLGLVRKYDA